MFGLMLDSCLLELYGNCLIFLLTLEENVAGVGEDVEVVEQEYQVQDSFEQGKLPLTCIYATIFEIATHQKNSGKRIKTLLPKCDKIFCHHS